MSTHALRVVAGLLVLLAGGCAAVDPPGMAPAATVPSAGSDPAPQPPAAEAEGIPYACDNGMRLHVRFGEGTVTIAGLPQGEESLLRDAGGVTPEQTVWSNERLRAEFGLPPAGEGAALHLLQPPAPALACRRQ